MQITASEIYSDGYSIFLTAKIEVEDGKLSKMLEHYTSDMMGEESTTAATMYTEGTWNLQSREKNELINNFFEGKVIDDHTFVGMVKLDVDEMEEKMVCWNYNFLTLDMMIWKNWIEKRLKGFTRLRETGSFRFRLRWIRRM